MFNTRSSGVTATRSHQHLNNLEHRTVMRWETQGGVRSPRRDNVDIRGPSLSPGLSARSPGLNSSTGSVATDSLTPRRVPAPVPGKVVMDHGRYTRDSVSPQRAPFNFATAEDRKKYYSTFIAKPAAAVDLYR